MQPPEGHPLHVVMITQLPAAESVGPDDIIVLVQGNETKRATVAQLAEAIRNIKPT
jgi:hypothetical protein